jgi:hypothetical protein
MPTNTQATGQYVGPDRVERSIASVGTTSGAATITAPASTWTAADVGRRITGSGIPAGTKILSVQSGTGATMTANASATATITAQVFGEASEVGFVGWSPETAAERAVHTVGGGGGATAKTRITSPTAEKAQYYR